MNPILALLAIVVTILEWRRSSWRAAAACAAAAALGLLGIYAVGSLDAEFSIWRDFDVSYSTHAAFATSVVVSLSFWRPRWRAVLITVLFAYLALIVIMAYHSVADVLTASVVACAVTAPWQFAARGTTLTRRFAPPSPAHAGEGPVTEPRRSRRP
ncbi:MAG: hypothetical protein AABO58_21520 [Acidobacteriota bacterium]